MQEYRILELKDPLMSMVECRDFFFYTFSEHIFFCNFLRRIEHNPQKKFSPFEADNKRHLLKERVLLAMICQNQ